VIVTVTPNPSIDRTLAVSELRRGAVLRCLRTTSEPSGKGVNVSIALHVNGHRTRAVLPVGGPDGTRLIAMLEAHGLDHVEVPVEGEVRTNVSLVEPDGTVTKINEPGPVLSAAELDRLLDTALDGGEAIAWLVGCGSLPAGAPEDFYARLVGRSRQAKAKVGIDSSGAPLAAALPAAPDLVKPNVEELAEVTGMPVRTIGEAVAAARRVQEMGARSVLASLGADGALLVEDDVVHGVAVIDQVQSAVGAGDALLAGFLAGGGDGARALESALAFAAAALRQPGTLMPGAEAVARSRVHIHERIDSDRRLREA
jgi:1-phosphofructokinase